ncbi:MAG: hypothetical protein ACXVI0_10835 [Halobacteriota archaeon]
MRRPHAEEPRRDIPRGWDRAALTIWIWEAWVWAVLIVVIIITLIVVAAVFVVS